MGTATKTQWEGRLGIELVGKMQGCCVKAILKWRPQMVGQKNSCTYCGSMMKTIRAGEVLSPTFVGWLGEEKSDFNNTEPEMVIGGLFFSKDKFATEEIAKTWMADRDIEAEEVIELDDHALYVPMERLMPESVRAIWVAPGVVGEIGISEKQVAVGGGQASMSSPGITTTSMASGGLRDPSQGPAATVAGATPNLMHGLTEPQDGHQHEFYLSPAEDAGGLRVKGISSYNNGHAHMIEAAVSSDGAFDSRTAPDQSVVGGHAHSHRVMFPNGGGSPMATKDKDEDPVPSPVVTKECRVTSMDISLLRKAADAIEGFYANVLGERGATKVADFKAQMNQAIERAKGGFGAVEGMVTIEGEDLTWLKNCSTYINDLGGRIAKGIGMVEVDKSVPSKAQVDAAGEAAGRGNVEALVDWAGDVGFDGCVAAIKGSKDAMAKIDDPEKVCGWLKARAREKGVLAPEHGGKKE